jgi:hypothetical protein
LIEAGCPQGAATSSGCAILVQEIVNLNAGRPAGDVAGVASASKRPHRVVVGSKRVTIPASHTVRVRIKLNRAGQRLLFKRHVLKVTLLIKQSGHRTITRTLVFKSKR